NLLFIGRLPSSCKVRDLQRAFESFGEIIHCDIKRGRDLSYGFVQFTTLESAQNAIRDMHNSTLLDHQIVVEMAEGRRRDKNTTGCFRCGEEGTL
ncbi:RNA-binding domain-containing protein, partial [Ramicandelaber brevisporus]